MKDNIRNTQLTMRGWYARIKQKKLYASVLRYRVFLVSESECRPTWLGPTYLYKYAHDICIGACEWIKLCAQQFATEFLNRDTVMLGATGIVPVSVRCNVQLIG